MADRYFVEQPISGSEAVLEGPEAHHLAHVMRAKAGDDVTLFDGSGAEFAARVAKVGRSEVLLEVLARQEIDRESRVRITLGVALPKGDRQRWLVEKGVELGVARIVPLETDRGVAQPVDKALDRLRRGVIEASKQCGRNRLMEIAPPQDWQRFVADAPELAARWIAHPGSSGVTAICVQEVPATTECYLGIGPEGGFTNAEVEAAEASGWRTVDLGPRILRIETAALYLASLAVAGGLS